MQVGQSVTLDKIGRNAVDHVADPRLNMDSFDAQVVSATCDLTQTSSGSGTVAAAPGAQLCVFGIGIQPENDDFLPDDVPYPALSFDYGTGSGMRRIGLSPSIDSASSDGLGAWVIAVPVGAPATLVLTQTLAKKQFSQAMNLRTHLRVPPAPPALYRAKQDSALVAPTPPVEDDLSGTYQGKPLSFALSLDEVALSRFPPEHAPSDIGENQAYLIVSPKVDFQKSAGLYGLWFPLSGMVLRLPDGHSIQAAGVRNVEGLDPGNSWYYFKVPATFTTATLIVTPGPKAPADTPSGHSASGFPAGTDLPVNDTASVTGQAKFSISVPDQAPLHLGPTTTTVPATTAPSSRVQHAAPALPSNPVATVPPSSGVGVLPWILIPLVLIAAGGGAMFVYRRSRGGTVAAGPVTVSHLALLAATPGELLRTRLRGELPKAPLLLDPAPAAAVDPDAWAPLAPGDVSDRSGEEVPEQPGAQPADSVMPVLVVNVLGPPDIQGLVGTIRRSALRRLLVALALAGRPVGVEELRDLIATDPDKPLPADQVHSYASKLRSVLPVGVLPPIGAGAAGYQLTGRVEVDAVLFDTLVTRAGETEGPERVELACRALRLVRGVPLSQASWEGIEPAVRNLTTRIENVAADTARACLAVRDARNAEWAISQGLLATPTAPVLWELRLTAAAAGSGVGLSRAWEQTRAVLDGDADALAGTYERLRTGQY